ncbi:hypothetical protein [Polluticaenibacter yanchengensis]|uniref:Tetratricopeptide repeat protein n=1 Tax=Polluticaenibacter yanchengensis TaxID=3014562 RepID=A0ABT4UI07_9BACT|nr:hypothetical protein [Chitinophagaceae bacterium LY-5]
MKNISIILTFVIAFTLLTGYSATAKNINDNDSSAINMAESNKLLSDSIINAQSLFEKKQYKNAAKIYNALFKNTSSYFTIIHGINAVICNTKIGNFDLAFKYLNKLVKECGFSNIYLHKDAAALSKLQADNRWKDILEAVDHNLNAFTISHN